MHGGPILGPTAPSSTFSSPEMVPRWSSDCPTVGPSQDHCPTVPLPLGPHEEVLEGRTPTSTDGGQFHFPRQVLQIQVLN